MGKSIWKGKLLDFVIGNIFLKIQNKNDQFMAMALRAEIAFLPPDHILCVWHCLYQN